MNRIVFVFFSFVVLGMCAKTTFADEKDQFSEIFIHPRDRHYVPEKAPSRPRLVDKSVVLDDARGPVKRYEYRSGGSVITRELWTNHRGESEGRFGIGFDLN